MPIPTKYLLSPNKAYRADRTGRTVPFISLLNSLSFIFFCLLRQGIVLYDRRKIHLLVNLYVLHDDKVMVLCLFLL